MNLSGQLASGECGVRWQPDDAELLGDRPRGAFWRNRRGVVLQAALSPLPYSLGTEDRGVDPVLRSDLEAAARAEFLAHWASTPAEGRRPARTDDPQWSPIVEVEAITLSGARAVRLIRRLSYAPGDELIVGHLIVPLAKGHIDLSVVTKAEMTGFRESAILITEKFDPETPMPRQSHYDRREMDAMFPQHPLSLVRAELDALASGKAIEVTRPAPPGVAGEVVLDGAGSAITPPPRFVPVGPGVLPLSPSLCMLARPAFGNWVRTFEVWRLAEQATDRRELEKLAARTIANWVNEGVQNIRARIQGLDDLDGRAQLSQDVRFVSGEEKHSHFRWIADVDGTVFRIGASGDEDTEFEQLRAEVAAAVPTWRRLDPAAPGDAPPTDKRKRPWWKPW